MSVGSCQLARVSVGLVSFFCSCVCWAPVSAGLLCLLCLVSGLVPVGLLCLLALVSVVPCAYVGCVSVGFLCPLKIWVAKFRQGNSANLAEFDFPEFTWLNFGSPSAGYRIYRGHIDIYRL